MRLMLYVEDIFLLSAAVWETSSKYYPRVKKLRNRNHVSCFYRIIETRVDFWENLRRPKLTKRGVNLFNIYTNVHREKRDIFTADIYYYTTTELSYAKRDLRSAAYGGVVLQRFEFQYKGLYGEKR